MSNENIIKQHFESIVSLVHEKLTLDEDIKLIKETLVAEGLEKKYISQMVKAAAVKAKEKIQEAKEDNKQFQEILDRFA
jgi:uncharacterized protein (UPF0335 family)